MSGEAASGGNGAVGAGGGGAVAPAPAAPSSSLAPPIAEAKANIEAMMGDPGSPYWQGSDTASAAEIQASYRDTLRGELAGQPDAVGPEHQVDLDLPRG